MILTKTAILLLWLGAVLDPVGQMFGIRYFAIGLSTASIAWLISIGDIQNIEKSYRSILILFIAGVFPIHGLFMYLLHAGANDFIDTSYIAAGLLIMFSLLYRNTDSCLFGINAFLFSTRILSVLIIAAYASSQVGYAEWLSFFIQRSVALVSFREYSGLALPYVYFLASPLLIFLLAHDLSKARHSLTFMRCATFVLSSFSLFLTGTRAHMIIAILFIPLYMLLTSNTKTIYKNVLFLGFFVLTGLAFQESRSLILSFFSASELSNSLKISLLDGYQRIFDQPKNLVFGQGFNAHEWSNDLRGMIPMGYQASKTELTYLELIRVFGVFIAAAFVFALVQFVRSTKSLPRHFTWIYPGLVIYLANAALNPYLFSVNGMLPLGLFSAIEFYFAPIKIKNPHVEVKE